MFLKSNSSRSDSDKCDCRHFDIKKIDFESNNCVTIFFRRGAGLRRAHKRITSKKIQKRVSADDEALMSHTEYTYRVTELPRGLERTLKREFIFMLLCSFEGTVHLETSKVNSE